MIVDIKAKFACDDCGTEFIVGIDPATVLPAEWSIFEVAENEIRAGRPNNYEDGTEPEIPVASGSVEDSRHYCDRCTRLRDS